MPLDGERPNLEAIWGEAEHGARVGNGGEPRGGLLQHASSPARDRVVTIEHVLRVGAAMPGVDFKQLRLGACAGVAEAAQIAVRARDDVRVPEIKE